MLVCSHSGSLCLQSCGQGDSDDSSSLGYMGNPWKLTFNVLNFRTTGSLMFLSPFYRSRSWRSEEPYDLPKTKPLIKKGEQAPLLLPRQSQSSWKSTGQQNERQLRSHGWLSPSFLSLISAPPPQPPVPSGKSENTAIDVQRHFPRHENSRVCAEMREMAFKLWIWVWKERKGAAEVCVAQT